MIAATTPSISGTAKPWQVISALVTRSIVALTRLPSEQLTAQAAFTPYPFEDVGAMIRDSNPDLYLFSSDYPHIEGGRDPLGRFTTSLRGFGADVDEKFYAGNMRRLLSAA